MSNMISSYGIPNGAPQQGFGGVIPASTELAVNRRFESYTVTGSGSIARLTILPRGATFMLTIESGVTFLHSSLLQCPERANYAAKASELIIVRSDGNGAWRVYPVGGVSHVPAGHIAGITLSNNATDATNDIDFGDGECASNELEPVLMRHAEGTSQVDVAYGTGNGGRFDTADTDGTWHCFVISNGINVKRGFSQSLDPTVAPNYPSGYTHFRRVGSIIRSGGANIIFTQVGRTFMRNAPSQLINITNPGTSAVTETAFVPNGIKVRALLTCLLLSGAANQTYRLLVTPLSIADTLPVTGQCQAILRTAPSLGETRIANVDVSVLTDTSRHFRYRVDNSDTSLTVNITVHGWIDDLIPD